MEFNMLLKQTNFVFKSQPFPFECILFAFFLSLKFKILDDTIQNFMLIKDENGTNCIKVGPLL